MKVFISWSGERGKLMAAALKDWLPLVIHYVDPFVSESNIEAGQRWSDVVARGLGESNFGILCVTSENVSSPWVLFEAGALAKMLEEARVVPLLLDMEFSGIAGPLAQFQAKKAEKAGLLEIVESINNSAPNPIPAGRYKELFDLAWPRLEKRFSDIPQAAKPAKQTRPQAEILEELVGAVRTMETRSREGTMEPRFDKRRRWNSVHMVEFASGVGEDPHAAKVRFLMVLSLLRDSAPWIYEIGMELYRSTKNRSMKNSPLYGQFRVALDIFIDSPMAHDDLGPEGRRVFKALVEATERLVEDSSSRRGLLEIE